MITGGMTSVTFRKLDIPEIIDLAKKSQLQSIEWGGDAHVPPGSIKAAIQAKTMTLDAGLKISSYGSYYKVGESEYDGLPFPAVLESAAVMGAPVIRIWAGKKGSTHASFKYRLMIADDTVRVAEMAAKAKIRVAFEFHNGSLTDTNESAVRLLQDINHPNVDIYWQPLLSMGHEDHMRGLEMVMPNLSNIHVYHWETDSNEVIKRPLDKAKNEWLELLTLVAAKSGRDHCAILEFVKDDSPKQFLKDAKTLLKIIEEANAKAAKP